MTHEFAADEDCERCCVAHFDDEGSCYRCLLCREWVRPSKRGERCLATADPMTATEVRHRQAHPPWLEATR